MANVIIKHALQSFDAYSSMKNEQKKSIFNQISNVMAEYGDRFKVLDKEYFFIKGGTFSSDKKIPLLKLSGKICIGNIVLIIWITSKFPNTAPICYVDKQYNGGLGFKIFSELRLVDKLSNLSSYSYLKQWNESKTLLGLISSLEEYVIKSQREKETKSTSSHNNNCNYTDNDNNIINNNVQHQNQMMNDQQYINMKQKITTKTQKLLESTENHLQQIESYLNTFINNRNNKKKLSFENEKVAGSTMLYGMEIRAYYKLQRKNNSYNFNKAFKMAEFKVNNFHKKMNNKIVNNNKNEINERMIPLLNFMYCVLQDIKAPVLPYCDNGKFNKEIANNTLSKFTLALNHTEPQKNKIIDNNWKHHEKNQNEYYNKHVKDNKNKFKINPNIDPLSFYKDVNQKDLKLPKSNKELREMNNEDIRKYNQNGPNLIDQENGLY